jgi:hypothetical protein
LVPEIELNEFAAVKEINAGVRKYIAISTDKSAMTESMKTPETGKEWEWRSADPGAEARKSTAPAEAGVESPAPPRRPGGGKSESPGDWRRNPI